MRLLSCLITEEDSQTAVRISLLPNKDLFESYRALCNEMMSRTFGTFETMEWLYPFEWEEVADDAMDSYVWYVRESDRESDKKGTYANMSAILGSSKHVWFTYLTKNETWQATPTLTWAELLDLTAEAAE